MKPSNTYRTNKLIEEEKKLTGFLSMVCTLPLPSPPPPNVKFSVAPLTYARRSYRTVCNESPRTGGGAIPHSGTRARTLRVFVTRKVISSDVWGGLYPSRCQDLALEALAKHDIFRNDIPVVGTYTNRRRNDTIYKAETRPWCKKKKKNERVTHLLKFAIIRNDTQVDKIPNDKNDLMSAGA